MPNVATETHTIEEEIEVRVINFDGDDGTYQAIIGPQSYAMDGTKTEVPQGRVAIIAPCGEHRWFDTDELLAFNELVRSAYSLT